ncbi:hypothetical protein ABTZ44_00890 [Microbacterium oxydans]|jgi:hypothetical protein|uniref:Uncharacterized protein n=2 Tax=Microbacterium TaxID=33882 RepID=A0A3S9WJQ3_9MICO|nr:MULTISPECIES: hypothetical protein [Microbacterium]AZS40271.1 hypothetical protein CVS54_01597 [Microbacterium oxydans]KKX96763.1 hypothetical protein AAY78_15770 [Microbacterium sp. Ag1]MBE7954833.1 hypothetical protein [Microbacterium sp. R1]NYF30081.1 hypothetical protein [Microbacterium sp. JAI119]
MSTSDRQEQGPLTRKQLREIRLTGSTPVITSEEAAAAAEAAPPAPPLPRAADPVEVAPAPVVDAANGDAPLTRRQVRELEKVRTASVPVVTPEGTSEDGVAAAGDGEAEQPAEAGPSDAAAAPAEIVSGVPDFTRNEEPGDADDDDDDDVAVEPVRASVAADAVGEVPLETTAASTGDEDDVAAALGLPAQAEDAGEQDPDDVLADVDDAGDEVVGDARPTVNSAFGEGLLADAPDPHAPFRPSFDELLTVGDSTGSQHSAPNALIFTPSPGEGSLSGPVASTGEILVTGSYELPQGMGSQGHALGTTDGKDVDAVLIDGELPPASSPTPIAASSAVSTIKPAGEVIRPPAPEKGNRLMITLAIVAGGLALAVGVVVIIAITTNVF